MNGKKKTLLIVFVLLIMIILVLVVLKTKENKTVNSDKKNIEEVEVAKNKKEEKKDTEVLRVVSIDDKKIRLENAYIIYLNNKDLKFTNARTKEKYSISNIKVKDWIRLDKIKEIKMDKDLLILDSESAEVIRNLKGKRLLDEILYSYTLNIQFVNGEMKDPKKLKNGEYLVTFILEDYYNEITLSKEKFEKTFKITNKTLLGKIYKTRYENIINAKDNMVDMVLDKNTLKQKYPECKIFTFYDG